VAAGLVSGVARKLPALARFLEGALSVMPQCRMGRWTLALIYVAAFIIPPVVGGILWVFRSMG
jgi:hypothetical protein